MFSVIFDMDGTLLDTQRICIPAWDYAGNLQGFKNVGQCIYKVCGMNEVGWTAYLEKQYPEMNIDEFKKEMRDYIINNGKVRFKEGAKELLDFLKNHKVKLAIASGSSLKSVEHHLNEVKAMDYFDAIAAGKEVKNGKPAPDIFLLAAEKLGVKPCDCFVFEDSANGIRAGYAAGMKCIGVPDIIPFESEIKKMMFKELGSLSQAINIFKDYIKKAP